MSSSIFISLIFSLCIYLIHCDWIAIDYGRVTTWNEQNADRSQILTKFEVINYPSKYVRGLELLLDCYTYDINRENLFFVMQQGIYGISKIFKYNIKSNQVDQTAFVQSFLIDQIQYNDQSKKLYVLSHNSTYGQSLLQIDRNTLEVTEQVTSFDHFPSSLPGSYYHSQKQYWTYHAYDYKQDITVLLTLNLSDNATERFIQSKIFSFNVYGFGFVEPSSLIALWQYSIITPMLTIQIDETTGQQMRNRTITPAGIRIAEGPKPFALDLPNRSFYVLSCADDLSETYMSKIDIDTMKLNLTRLEGQKPIDYIFFKR